MTTGAASELAKSFFRETLTAQDVLAFLPSAFGAELEGDRGAAVDGVAALENASAGTLFYSAVPPRSGAPEPDACAGIAICSRNNRTAVPASVRIVVDDPRAAFIAVLNAVVAKVGIDYAKSMEKTAGRVRKGSACVHPSAIVEEDVILGDGVSVGANAVIGRGTIIAEGTIIRSATIIGESGAAIHKSAQGEIFAQPHVGLVHIGAGCEIGVHSTVIRGMLGATRIGNGSRLGNYVNVGHGAQLGAGTWIGVGSLIGGHARIGENATVGMGAAIRDNLTIGLGASVAMGAVVTKPVPDGASVFGNPGKIIARRLAAGPKR